MKGPELPAVLEANRLDHPVDDGATGGHLGGARHLGGSGGHLAPDVAGAQQDTGIIAQPFDLARRCRGGETGPPVVEGSDPHRRRHGVAVAAIGAERDVAMVGDGHGATVPAGFAGGAGHGPNG